MSFNRDIYSDIVFVIWRSARKLRISRLKVDGGFLDGMDLSFLPGFNVLIGPRGAGKTSVIELIRFALGVKAHNDTYESAARDHALAVLREGEVTVTIDNNGSSFAVSRTAEDLSPKASGRFVAPIIFSQKEVESIGLHGSSRLRILDGFRTGSNVESKKGRLTGEIASLTAECQSISNEIQSFNDQIELLQAIPKQLESAKQELSKAMRKGAKTRAEETKLKNITHKAAELSVQSDVFARTSKAITGWESKIEKALTTFSGIEKWPKSAGKQDLLADLRKSVQSALDTLTDAYKRVQKISSRLEELAGTNQDERQIVEQQIRGTRDQLEIIEKGISALSRRVKDLEERKGQLSALKNAETGKREYLINIQNRRAGQLTELDSLLKNRFRERVRIANDINDRLGPHIEVRVEMLGLEDEVVSAISEALKGSGMHSTRLAPQLARKMTPRELVESIELRDPTTISECANISIERADRLVTELSMGRTEGILTATVEDSVRFFLLDGGEYKSTENLSVGQRCTVILPILLGHHERTLVVDQPEDHLDNAFIVDTLIGAISESKSKGQLIFSTHNANIPVLGEADQVILLRSDGRKGFAAHAGALDDPESVKAITDVMEGGRDAFEKRAKFYSKRSK